MISRNLRQLNYNAYSRLSATFTSAPTTTTAATERPIGTISHLIRFFGERIISIAVPIVGFATLYSMYGEKNADMEDLFSRDFIFDKFMKPYGDNLEIERLNDKLAKYKRAFMKADPAYKGTPMGTTGEFIRKQLKLDKRKVEFAALEKAENDYLRERLALSLKKKNLIASQRKASIDKTMAQKEFDKKDLTEKNAPIGQVKETIGEIMGESKSNANRNQLTEIAKAELELEKAFLEKVHAEVIGKFTSAEVLTILSHFATSHNCGPLFNLPESRRHVYVLTFNGDVAASQVKNLREEVTAILGEADPERGDCVVIRLNSSGGTVTGYGLAAAQLERLKSAGINVVVCIDEVAASGGYMMAVVAHKIYASPLAAIGSIGVIATAPNIQKRLKREGIEFDEITAGQYKRTLTPFKEPNAKDRKKLQDDISAIFELFKMHIQRHRPIVNLRMCATGEVWFGDDALKRNLCDELLTSDDVLMKMHEDGSDIYSVKHTQKKKQEGLFSNAARRALMGLFLAIFSSSDVDFASDLETSSSYLVKDLSMRNENHSVHYKYAKNQD